MFYNTFPPFLAKIPHEDHKGHRKGPVYKF